VEEGFSDIIQQMTKIQYEKVVAEEISDMKLQMMRKMRSKYSMVKVPMDKGAVGARPVATIIPEAKMTRTIRKMKRAEEDAVVDYSAMKKSRAVMVLVLAGVVTIR
jgi:hypothetical protein